MHIQSLVVVVLRLMALDFLLQAAVQLTPHFLQFLRIYESAPGGVSRPFMALPWVILACLLTVAVLLWCLALPIARFVTRGVPQELSFGAMSLADCYSIAFMGIGLFYIASHLPQVLNWAHYFLKAAASGSRSSEQGVNGYDVSQVFITFITGVVLFVNGRRWAVVWATKQQKAESPNQRVERTGAPPPGPEAR